ncbi:hypothetical protein GCM10010174_80890 [Kutzneria viridogrisea]|uniref:Membrane protein n=1 Tax=Kutzneria viridogrisea TaxID=47990 RepID=A0ABR6BZ21_9PSEU|nr:putative membrane protein [Kutzneria viridogrisea]
MLWLAGLLFLVLRKVAKKWTNKYVWFLPFTFLALAVFALAVAPLPFGWGTVAGIAAKLVGWVLGWVGGLFGVNAQVAAGVLLVIVLVLGLHDLIKDHKPDGWARTMLFSLPVLTVVASGTLATKLLEFSHLVGGVGPTVVNSITG